MSKHTLSRARREQARRPGPDRRAVLPPRLQHRLARGRPDRAPRGLPDDDRRRRRGAAARAGDQAAQQAGQRASRSSSSSRPASVQRELLLVKVRADAATRIARRSRPSQLFRAKVVDVAPDAVTIEATGNARQARGAAAGARAVRHPGAGPVRHGRHRPRAALDHRPRPAHRLTAGRPAPPAPTARRTDRHVDPTTHQPKERPTVAEMFYDDDADLSIIQGRKVAVIGYGSQGHAHALTLRDSGVDVRVGLRRGQQEPGQGRGRGPARASPRPRPCEEADVIMILAPGPRRSARSTPRRSSRT